MRPVRNLLFSFILAGLSLACNLVSLIPIQTKEPDKVQVFDSRKVEIADTKVETYTLNGTTEDELRLQMNEDGPISDNNLHYDAITRWWIQWSWPPNGEGGCNLAQVKVVYTIVVILPCWDPSPEVSTRLVEKWNKYLAALVEHEKGHVQNVMVYVPQVKQAVINATCNSANDAANAVLDELRTADRSYDEQTGHGVTEGARFP